MSAIPAFKIGVWNAWIFMSVFLLQMLVVFLGTKKVARRTGHPDDMRQDKYTRRVGAGMTVTWLAAMLYSVFLPFKLDTAWFYTGVVFFLLGVIVLVIATVNFSTAPMDKPIDNGIYRYSRHPMYLSMFLVYIGISITAASWLFFLITIASAVLQRMEAKLEEEYCLIKYGDSYREYLEVTPRWIGIPKQV